MRAVCNSNALVAAILVICSCVLRKNWIFSSYMEQEEGVLVDNHSISTNFEKRERERN